jgi:hypothetical protein
MAAHPDPHDDLDLVLQASAPRGRSEIVGIRELLRGRPAATPGRTRRRQLAVLAWTSTVVAAGAAGAWVVHEALFPDTGTATAVSVWQNPGRPPEAATTTAATTTNAVTTPTTPATTTETTTPEPATAPAVAAPPGTLAADDHGRPEPGPASGPGPAPTALDNDHSGPGPGPATTLPTATTIEDRRGRDGGGTATTIDDHSGRDGGSNSGPGSASSASGSGSGSSGRD